MIYFQIILTIIYLITAFYLLFGKVIKNTRGLGIAFLIVGIINIFFTIYQQNLAMMILALVGIGLGSGVLTRMFAQVSETKK